MHGKTSIIYHDGKTLFAGLPNPFEATRYHSLVIKRETLPDCLEITAWTEDKIIMGVRHKEFLVEGVQFHPESILTTAGKDLLQNFIRLGGRQ
jgi:anthranilate synthase/aminodeoxychorismate synthase-like glutamine amidotransferase